MIRRVLLALAAVGDRLMRTHLDDYLCRMSNDLSRPEDDA